MQASCKPNERTHARLIQEGNCVTDLSEKLPIRSPVNRVPTSADAHWKTWVITDSFRKYIFSSIVSNAWLTRTLQTLYCMNDSKLYQGQSTISSLPAPGFLIWIITDLLAYLQGRKSWSILLPLLKTVEPQNRKRLIGLENELMVAEGVGGRMGRRDS